MIRVSQRAPLTSLFFAEEEFQIGFGEALGEAFLAEDVRDGLAFALLEVPDFFLNRSGGDKFVGVDGFGLADTVGAVNGLRFHGRIPPRIV